MHSSRRNSIVNSKAVERLCRSKVVLYESRFFFDVTENVKKISIGNMEKIKVHW